MLDINYIRENLDLVKKKIATKNYDPQLLDKLLGFDEERRKLLTEVDGLRAQRNIAAGEKNIDKGKIVKEKLSELEQDLRKVEEEFYHYLFQVPNLPFDDVPLGSDESDNKILKEVGEKPNFNFTLKDHLGLGQSLDILDFEAGSEVTGSGFYYLKNEGVILELALVRYALDMLMNKGYIPMITPDLAREKYYLATGYLPKGPEAQTYQIAETDLGLIATSEVTLAGYHGNQTLEEADLPKKYAGYSHCFRMEGGSYGKYSKGLYRVHQFTKVEMFGLAISDKSEDLHTEFLSLEEEFFQSLGIFYRVLEMCTGDLGSQAARKFDLEAWMPGRGDFGEVTSTSNTTDYQARNLNIKVKGKNGTSFVHTVNGTMVAVPRAIVAILENFQQEDGSVKIPEVLQKYTGFPEIRPK